MKSFNSLKNSKTQGEHLGRSYTEANGALASVNIMECCHKTFL